MPLILMLFFNIFTKCRDQYQKISDCIIFKKLNCCNKMMPHSQDTRNTSAFTQTTSLFLPLTVAQLLYLQFLGYKKHVCIHSNYITLSPPDSSTATLSIIPRIQETRLHSLKLHHSFSPLQQRSYSIYNSQDTRNTSAFTQTTSLFLPLTVAQLHYLQSVHIPLFYLRRQCRLSSLSCVIYSLYIVFNIYAFFIQSTVSRQSL